MLYVCYSTRMIVMQLQTTYRINEAALNRMDKLVDYKSDVS